MNKTELINAVAKDLEDKGLGGKRAATVAVNAALEAIQDALAEGEKVALTGFGSFERTYKPERDGRNPSTGAQIRIGESWSVKFGAFETLKGVVAATAKNAKVTVNA